MTKKKTRSRRKFLTVLLYATFAVIVALLFAILYFWLTPTFGLLVGLAASTATATTVGITGLIVRYLYLRSRTIVLHRMKRYVELARQIQKYSAQEKEREKKWKEELGWIPEFDQLKIGWLPEASRKRIVQKVKRTKDPQLRMRIIKREVVRDLWESEIYRLKGEFEYSGAKTIGVNKEFVGEMFLHEIDIMIKIEDRIVPIMAKWHREIMPSDVESVAQAYNDLKKTVENLGFPFLLTNKEISNIVQKCAQERKVTVMRLRGPRDLRALKKSMGLNPRSMYTTKPFPLSLFSRRRVRYIPYHNS